ncbi:MAG: hypothetical protein JWM91_946, partial [Rhodospirillales bacterium]|nr:hypothetical protein [Rhodospirillales bacterium]
MLWARVAEMSTHKIMPELDSVLVECAPAATAEVRALVEELDR